jgi:FtsH-binding integral membrane protein
MAMPIASLFGWAGLLGLVVARFLARFLGTSEHNLLVASSACLAFAGLIVLVHLTINYWLELKRTT